MAEAMSGIHHHRTLDGVDSGFVCVNRVVKMRVCASGLGRFAHELANVRMPFIFYTTTTNRCLALFTLCSFEQVG
jgi:hypothetical protein